MGDVVKGADYYMDLHGSTETSLNDLCDAWETKLSNNEGILSEEMSGEIRTTIGQGRLVTNPKGRLTQFKTLIENCKFNKGEKKTTTQDLQGFWDMISFQVDDVNQKFEQLTQYEKDGWKNLMKDEKVMKALPPFGKGDEIQEINNNDHKVKKGTRPPKIKVPQNTALKQLMAAKRKAMNTVEICVTAAKTPSPDYESKDSKVFEGGFFNVTSPIRPLAERQPPNTPQPKSVPSSPNTQRFEVDKSDAFLRRAVLTDSARRHSNSRSPFAMMRVNSVVKNLTVPEVKVALFADDEEENKENNN